ncbi:calmodulin-4, putative [Entamoeba invadens IP1]|uniref:Calmodulin-4, putative n=1 Tax=Entamoeba invadens IP1 TaxID=370355 RepID=A0A0A1U4F1_ENTIV|nr:calmodulin-4, putative [Entamoeba invadens IP1]ELP89142.1 calmodulin-4, putative [Entamoeba invadens IP1]|eukprot:XP_004255913.1 calmodulin-4, putative [Entamoeba invadens IP1]
MSVDVSSEQLATVFDILDVSKKGFLELSDVKEIFKSKGIQLSEEDLVDAFKAFDTNGDQKIDSAEFVAGLSEKLKKVSTAEELTTAFKAFDTENSGVLDTKTLTEELLKMENPPSQKQIDSLNKIAAQDDGFHYDLFVKAAC